MAQAVNERGLRIAAARREDAALIVSFIRQLAEYERLSDSVRVTEAMVEAALFGPRPAAEALLAYWDGQPVGFAVFFTNYSTFLGKPGLYLEDLFVVPEARWRGIGKALLRYLAKLCGERGYARLEWAVLDWNEPAIEFYKRLGAVPMSDWTVFRLTGDALAELANRK